MSRPRKIDLATVDDVNWDFAHDEVFMETLEGRVRYVARQQSLDVDDLMSETVLHIAARPEWSGRERKDPTYPVMAVAEQMRRRERNDLALSDIPEPAVGLDGR